MIRFIKNLITRRRIVELQNGSFIPQVLILKKIYDPNPTGFAPDWMKIYVPAWHGIGDDGNTVPDWNQQLTRCRTSNLSQAIGRYTDYLNRIDKVYGEAMGLVLRIKEENKGKRKKAIHEIPEPDPKFWRILKSTEIFKE